MIVEVSNDNLNPMEIQKLIELKNRLHMEEKQRKQEQEMLTGVFKLFSSMVVTGELLDYYGDHLIALKKAEMKDKLRYQLSNQEPNRAQKKQLEKDQEQKEKEIRIRNKSFKKLMLEMTKVFESDKVLNDFKDEMLENTIEFYDKEITYEKITKILNP